MRLRSLLYVPADNARFIGKAHERGADAIILDLEDSVLPAYKEKARAALAEAVPAVGQGGAKVFVRVNAEAGRFAEDAGAACRAGAFGLLLPKAKDLNQINGLDGLLALLESAAGRAPLPVIALIEDAAAMLDARTIAGHKRIMGLALGGEDFALATGAEPTPEVLRYPKLAVHYAAKAAQKMSFGLLRSVADYADVAGLAAAAREARSFGFDGATCVHPSAVPLLNAAFSPSADELTWAQKIVDAAKGSPGAFALDGRMIDAPVIARARRILGED